MSRSVSLVIGFLFIINTALAYNSSCSDLGIPRNGYGRDHSFRHNNKIRRLSCKKVGWKRIGVDTIQCNDGQWNYDVPICKAMASCSDPGIPRDAHRLGHSFHHNNVVWFVCYKGLKMKGVPVIRCDNGHWDHNVPTCLGNSFVEKKRIQKPGSGAPCSDPGTPIGGYRHDHSFNHNDEVKFSCGKNWTMYGNDTIRCNNGRWDKKAPKCVISKWPRILGCFRDLFAKPRPLPKLLGYFYDDSNSFLKILMACAWKAQQMNISTFGVKSGACWGGTDDTYSRDGKSSDCIHPIGVRKPGSIFVCTFNESLGVDFEVVTKAIGNAFGNALANISITNFCFPANAKLRLKTGGKTTMENLKLGDQVQTLDISTNEIIYTEVLAFLHKDQGQELYHVIEVEDGNRVLLSGKHLVSAGKTKTAMDMRFAEKVKPGDYVLSGNTPSRVTSVKTVHDSGVYAPMTRHGTMLVDGIYVSCYAHWGSHEVAHRAMAPLRLWYDLTKVVKDAATAMGMGKFVNGTGKATPQQGIHGYAKFLMVVSKYLP